MFITVSEAMSLNQFQHIQLIAGQKGLKNTIKRIGILDFEIVEGIIGDFFEGDFVLTSFTAARDNLDLVKQCIKDLISCKVAALAIKSVYYKTLPLDILEEANKKGLPIFMFDHHVYFEYIIEDIMDGIHERSRMNLLSTKIDVLYKGDLKGQVVRTIGHEINRHFLDNHCVVYLKETAYLSDQVTLKLSERFNNSRLKSVHHSMVKYEEGIILILTYKDISPKQVTLDLDHIFRQMGIIPGQFLVGLSNITTSLGHLNQSIKEAIYAAQVADLNQSPKVYYENIGLYQLLLPIQETDFTNKYIHSVVTPLEAYDEGKLIETLQVYLSHMGNVKETAQALYQHTNTIRYRLKKAKEILNIDSDFEFYEKISLAFKLKNLKSHETKH